MPIFGTASYVGLLVGGGFWCAWMFRRWRSDLDEFRSTANSTTKVVIASLWGLTALILISMLRTAVEIGSRWL